MSQAVGRKKSLDTFKIESRLEKRNEVEIEDIFAHCLVVEVATLAINVHYALKYQNASVVI